MNELQRIEPAGALERPSSQGLSIEAAYEAIVSGNLDKDKLEVIQKLLAMNAEQKFNAAFVKLQSELPVIVATTAIKNRGKYEKFEDVMHQIAKPLQDNGFSVSFSQDFKENRIIVTCTLMHSGGHSRTNPYAVRVSGNSDTETQADCKASTTAKRNALLQALNVIVRQDCLNTEDDAANEGDPNAFVTPAQAFELERRANETNSNIPAFLSFAKAATFATIKANRYTELDEKLALKERAGK